MDITIVTGSLILLWFYISIRSQIKEITTDIFTVVYNEDLEQPVKLTYIVQCPLGDASRSGMDFYIVDNIHTSDNEDYVNNIWDKGHLAPAASFNCDKETLKKTFSYLNCALQHEGLNRGPWKELERFERDLAKFYEVKVEIFVIFDEPLQRVPGGAAIPTKFIKNLCFDDRIIQFEFPNLDVAGQDWSNFIIAE